ncbi:MAG TPA: DUF1345 domain-containing protein [Acetobacteraceae bacterium]|jgi:uncharacterized membrane protein|nr:DUF1345 domain-containing protein [Acetobacteraceae bacterium]
MDERRGVLGLAWRIAVSRPRLWAGVACGVLAWVLLPAALSTTTRAVVAWDCGALLFLGLAAFLFGTERRSRVAADAARQQEGEWTIFSLTIAATVFSLAAILGEFATTKDLHGVQRDLHIALMAGTLLISWLTIHILFAFRYAHEFYACDINPSDPDGGLEFPGEQHPDYLDFVYFALVLGMTFQVSDVQITARKMRRLATVHGLLSFLFNTIILALSVNLAAGLV